MNHLLRPLAPISDSACGETRCIPSSRSVFASEISLMRPSVSFIVRARPEAIRFILPTLIS